MATEMIAGRPPAESHTLRAEEERLRAHLEQQLRVRTRFAPLADVRALLVSPDRDDRPKSLVVSSQASIAERIYLYVHVAAHIALGHHLPLVTIVEGPPGVTRFTDASRHRRRCAAVSRPRVRSVLHASAVPRIDAREVRRQRPLENGYRHEERDAHENPLPQSCLLIHEMYELGIEPSFGTKQVTG